MYSSRLLALLAIILALDTPLLAAERPPNVVFILADDAGFGDFGCYGHPCARTPHIDRLAAEGTRFRQFYSTGVTCCPARTGLMTSRWPASFATHPANGGFGDRVTITQLLKQRGYATGHFGKWHIGPEEKSGTYGIDVTGADDVRGGKHKQTERGRDAPIYDDAIRFIEQHRSAPFYVNVWSHVSHHPVNPPQAYVDKFKDVVVDEARFSAQMREKFARCRELGGDASEHLRRYLADLFSMDEDIGRLLRRLDELKLRENTIVVFSTDQGPAPLREWESDPEAKRKKKRGKLPEAGRDIADLRLNAMGDSGELRGGKHGMYEGGVRVPFIVRWPGRVPAGRVDEQSVISGIDWLPTLCAIAGVKIDPADFHGEDVSAAWLGKTPHVRTKPLLWKTSAPGSDAGIRDGQWKLIHPTRKRGEIELYDIPADPAESRNIATQHPGIVKTLSAKVEAWIATLPKEYLKSDDREN